MDDIIGGRLVGGDGNVIDNGDAQECLDVGIVRLGLQGIPEKDDDVDLPFGDLCADLLIAAERARKIAFDLQPRRFGNEFCRRARAAKVELGKRFLIGDRPLNDLVFLVVVRDERDGLFLQNFFLRIVFVQLFFYYTANPLSLSNGREHFSHAGIIFLAIRLKLLFF